VPKKPFRVLCIDGGGMRGLYTAELLSILAQRFDARFKQSSPDFGKAFDLICGTSTGAILACALAAGIPIKTIAAFYREFGVKIFTDPMPSGPKDPSICWWAWRNRKKPAANPGQLRKALTDIFSTTTVKQLYEKRKIALCIPAINAQTYKAWVFKTPHNAGKTRDDNYTLVDVCMASSAAPILFPIAQFKNPDTDNIDNFVDGGLWANNPILMGLIEAAAMINHETHKLEVLSIGTCDRPSGDPYSSENPNLGVEDWKVGMNIVEMSISAQSFGYTNAARFLAATLNRLGMEATVVRLDQTNKSPEQYSAINIDKADKLALHTLGELARTDAEDIHSKALGSTPGDLGVVKEIFSNLADIQ
jgi:uncharacterized protein